MAPLEKQLTPDEHARNAFGLPRMYEFDAEGSATYKSPTFGFVDVVPCRTKSVALASPHCHPGREHKGLCEDFDLSRVRIGFPSFLTLPFTHELKEINAVVFDQPSRNASMLVSLQPEG